MIPGGTASRLARWRASARLEHRVDGFVLVVVVPSDASLLPNWQTSTGRSAEPCSRAITSLLPLLFWEAERIPLTWLPTQDSDEKKTDPFACMCVGCRLGWGCAWLCACCLLACMLWWL